jgi:hypothetical protein
MEIEAWETATRNSEINTILINGLSQVAIAHTLILATQEAEIRRINDKKPAQANSSQDPISKTPFTKKGWQRTQALRVLT